MCVTEKLKCLHLLIISVAVPVLIINMVARPFHRGFFCDDQSLMHPFKEDTVPTWLLVVVGMGLPIVSVSMIIEILVDCILHMIMKGTNLLKTCFIQQEGIETNKQKMF